MGFIQYMYVLPSGHITAFQPDHFGECQSRSRLEAGCAPGTLNPSSFFHGWMEMVMSNHFSMAIWVVVSNIFYFHPYLGKIAILTNIVQMG